MIKKLKYEFKMACKDCVKGGTRNETNSKYEIRITEQEKERYKEAYLLLRNNKIT